MYLHVVFYTAHKVLVPLIFKMFSLSL